MTAASWKALVEEQARSGQTIAAYANPKTVKILRDGSVLTNEYSSMALDFRLPVHAGDRVFIEESLFIPAPARDIEIAVPERWKRARAIYEEMSAGGLRSLD